MEAVCRDRYLQLPVTYFKLLSCSMCYKYLFYTGNHLQPHSQQPWTLVPTSNSELYSKNFSVIADVNDEPSKRLICDSLTEEDCTRWTDCCNAATSCCEMQLSTPTSNRSESSYCPRTWDGYSCFGDTEAGTRTYFSCPSYVPHTDISEKCRRWTDCCNAATSCCEMQLSTAKSNRSEPSYCPRIWDGYSCFGDTEAGTRTYVSCPTYLPHADTSEMAFKDCNENGTWWVDPTSGAEWTNYSSCVPKDNHNVIIYVSLASNIVSLAMLIPACVIFIAIRQLRVQKRIKLHINLFLSFVLHCLVLILWDTIVYRDRLQNEKHDTIMHRNSGGCKFLYILTRYASTVNFFWMSCEGFYLHRLIVHAFATPKSLTFYYIFGWVVSWIPALAYSIIRATTKDFDSDCWIHNIDGYEWLLYTPNLLSLVVNIIFLGNIIRILCSKLQAHPNEPSNYRKALKATFVLLPLFGLQQFAVIYRPHTGTKVDFIYEIVQTVFINTQGAIVSLIFCFLNGEVHTYLRNCIGRHTKLGSSLNYNRKSSMSSATQFTSVASARRATKQYETSDSAGYIPLSTSSTANDMSNTIKSTNGHVTFAT